jgi:hypothetical protein
VDEADYYDQGDACSHKPLRSCGASECQSTHLPYLLSVAFFSVNLSISPVLLSTRL